MTRVLSSLLAASALATGAFAGSLEWDGARGSVRSFSIDRSSATVYTGDAVTIAQAFLKENRAMFNGSGTLSMFTDDSQMDIGDELETRVSRVDDDGKVRFVRFQQEVEGIEVDGGDLVVAVRADGTVSSVQGGYAADGHTAGVRGFANGLEIAEADAVAAAKADLAAEIPGDYEASKLVYWVSADGDLVKSYRVDLSAQKPRGDWSIHVDAQTGKVLSKQNMLRFAHGKVFMSNPLRDNNIVSVDLERLTGNGNKLVGDYVQVKNGKGSTIVATDGNFDVEKSSPHFAEVMAYFHIDRIHQNLKEIDPDFSGMDFRIPITVHDKGSFFMKNDNAFYSPFKKAMFILDPKKLNDLHLEASVSYHEYHHAVTDNIVPGLNSTEGRAMHEGYSDYFACALTADPEIGEWALQPLNRPNMRDLTSQRHYPEDLHPQREPHSDGEIWAAACWDLRAAIPADKADFLVHKSRSYLSGNATFKSAYEAMVQADTDFLGGEYGEAVTAVFDARGITGETVSDAGEEADPEAIAAFDRLHAND